jgi:hypothetical protein
MRYVPCLRFPFSFFRLPTHSIHFPNPCSIHKSQGQTIARVKVDLGKVFEKGAFTTLLFLLFILVLTPSVFAQSGQSYVALSRATSLDGLQVLRFDAKKVAAHEKVVTWSVRLGWFFSLLPLPVLILATIQRSLQTLS